MPLDRLPWLPGALLALAALAPGCGRDASPVPPVEEQPAGPKVSFVEADPLTLAPGQHATLSARVTPASSGEIRFALLEDSGDASLDRSSAPVDAGGVATVTLLAPRQARSFQVRASIDGGSRATRQIMVSGASSVSVRVTALYLGKRVTTSAPVWTATIEADVAGCPGAPGTPLATASGALPLALPAIPTDRPLLVRLRAGAAVEGCSPAALTPADEQRTLEVVATNTPVRAPTSPLALALTVAPDLDAWLKALTLWQSRFQAAFLGGQSDDPQAARALLDTMILVAAPAQRAPLMAARQAQSWNTLAAAHLAQHPGPATALAWASKGYDLLRSSPGAITGQLHAESSSTVSFTPADFLLLRADDALASKVSTWSVSADDKVRAGGEVSLWPTRLLGRAAELASGQSAGSGATALRQQADCPGLASALGSTLTCTTACLASLCDQATGVMWTRALVADENASTSASLKFVASGPAALDDGRLTGFTGSWVGTLIDTQGPTVSFAGAAQATELP